MLTPGTTMPYSKRNLDRFYGLYWTDWLGREFALASATETWGRRDRLPTIM
jgi:hypothetical protein